MTHPFPSPVEVERRAFLEIPPRVEYHLTGRGQEFGDAIAAIEQFFFFCSEIVLYL